MNDPSIFIINVEDYPHIDWRSDDGQEALGAIAAHHHVRNPHKWHFKFQCDGKEVGEMIFTGGFDSSGAH